MKIIEAHSPGKLWQEAATVVYKNGAAVMDGQDRLKELTNVVLVCENPLESDRVLDKFADKKMLDFMLGNFLEKEPVLDWGYSYGARILDYNGTNQLKNIIDKLKRNRESKSATINLMDPSKDGKHVPCICTLDFKIRDGRVQCAAFFRSQDAGKKIYADMISLGELTKKVANETGSKAGALTIFIASLHIYEKDIDSIVRPLMEFTEDG
ncbi:thymidylate synthase [Candidatus Marsarchaeota archaeon]|nr:thymidylate synthase [Candidatus Marsarchaeota archaeon]MCL5099888.1 thymidylate synthase [Candidatus Marsarchaeota archaeon]